MVIGADMVHTMNQKDDSVTSNIPIHQAEQFRNLVLRLFQCCQERTQYQCERFGLPDAQIRCLLLFGEERYLTAKGIAYKLNVVKSRVTKIVEGLIRKKLLQKVPDPEDSRIVLLSLTPKGQLKLKEINGYMLDFNSKVLGAIHPDQRSGLLNNLELLRISMEMVNERMG
jgi:DNA-binding MarR family transcriptional regulator